MQSPHIGGDCSLWVRSATIDFDDGLWECQVTSSDFTTQDALTSQPVRLVVRGKFATQKFRQNYVIYYRGGIYIGTPLRHRYTLVCPFVHSVIVYQKHRPSEI